MGNRGSCVRLRFARSILGIKFSGSTMFRKDGFTADLCRTRLVNLLRAARVLGLAGQLADVHIGAFSDSAGEGFEPSVSEAATEQERVAEPLPSVVMIPHWKRSTQCLIVKAQNEGVTQG
jgi:hypothetical protein